MQERKEISLKTHGKIPFQSKDLQLKQSVVFFVLFILTVIISLFCMEESPLYRYSSTVDGSVYMNVGNAMKNGAVMYRDVFDHKGPLFFLFMWLLSVLPGSTRIAFFSAEILAGFFTVVIAYKICKLYLNDILSFFITCLIFPFIFGGTLEAASGSVEQFLLPLFFLFMYIYLLFWENYIAQPSGKKEPSACRFRTGYFVIAGIICGIYLLCKMNICFIFLILGLSVFIWLCLQRKGKQAFVMLGMVCLGIVIASIPVVIYCICNNCFQDVWDGYVSFNLIYAGTPSYLQQDIPLAMAYLYTLISCPLASPWLIASSVMVLLIKKYPLWMRVSFSISTIAFFLITYSTKRIYVYIFLSFIPFSVVGIIWTVMLLQELSKSRQIRLFEKWNKRSISIALVVFLSVILFGTIISNGKCITSPRFLNREVTGYEKIAEMITTITPEGETPSTMLFGFNDASIYYLTDTTSQIRYFYTPNINANANRDVYDTQCSYVKDGIPDVILSSVFFSKEMTDDYVYIGNTYMNTEEEVELFIYVYVRDSWVNGNEDEINDMLFPVSQEMLEKWT